PRWGRSRPGRLVYALAKREIEIAILRRELHSPVALTGSHQLDPIGRSRAELTSVHLKIFAAEIAMAAGPQLLHDAHEFGAVIVAFAEMIVARPQPHLAIFDLVPARDDVDAESSSRNIGDCRGHARDDGRRYRQDGDRSVKSDMPRHR